MAGEPGLPSVSFIPRRGTKKMAGMQKVFAPPAPGKQLNGSLYGG
jgi:hypothetical protein